MDDLRRRFIEVRQADHTRKNLLDDLFQKSDDMQKTMDRNAFIMVLIDGDCTLVRDPPTSYSSTLYIPLRML
jgi:hypothetical protein